MSVYKIGPTNHAERLAPVKRTYASLDGSPEVRTTPELLDLYDGLKIVSPVDIAQSTLGTQYKKHINILKDSHRLLSETFGPHIGFSDVSADAEITAAIADMEAKNREKVQKALGLVRLMPPEQVKWVRWEGDRTGDRMVVPNTWLKGFLTTFVKTSMAYKLQAELIREHSLNEAPNAEHVERINQTHAVTAGTPQQVSALSGTGATPDEAPSLTNNAASQMTNSMESTQIVRSDFGQARLDLDSTDQRKKRAAEDFLDTYQKKQRIELFDSATRLLHNLGCLDAPTTSWWQRITRNEMSLMFGNTAAPMVLTNHAGSSSETVSVAGPVVGNPFWWTAVSRAQHLNSAWRCKDNGEECKLGRRVSDACLAFTGQRPADLNAGKAPQQDANGVTRPTNVFTDTQASAWADAAIGAFFA